MQVALIEKIGATWHHIKMTDEKFPSQLAERFQIRMPDGLRDKIRAVAEASGRSMNVEIVKRLEDSFQDQNEEHLASIQGGIAYLVNTIRDQTIKLQSKENEGPLDRVMRDFTRSFDDSLPYLLKSEWDEIWGEFDRLKSEEANNSKLLLEKINSVFARARLRKEAPLPPIGEIFPKFTDGKTLQGPFFESEDE